MATAYGPSAQAEGDFSAAIGYGAQAPNHFQITLGVNMSGMAHEVHVPGTLVLYSPNGSMWAISVSDTGTLAASSWTPPNVSPMG